MISVPNHRQRSNGNRSRIPAILLVIILAGSLQGCAFLEDLFQGEKKKPRTEKPDEKTEVEIREIEWEDVTDEEEVIRNYPDKTEDREDIFDVLCLLPFNGANKDKGRSLYAGIKMAANDIDTRINLRITTLDISRLVGEPETLRKLLSIPQFDVILTPYATDNVNKVIDLVQGSGSLVVSPWNTSPSIKRFDHYLQLNPGLESHFSGMVDWTAREFGAPQTLIVSNKKDMSSVKTLQKDNPQLESYYTALNPTEDIPKLEELIASKNVEAIIIPSWRSSDEAYFLSLLSAINAARGFRTISVVVLSSWMDNNDINFDQYRGLNLHFTNSRFKNTESRVVQRLEDQYIREYNYFPDDEVFYGHDVYRMIVEWLTTYDRRIRNEIINYECPDCFFRYDFVDEVTDDGKSYILNDHVDIISLRNFQYNRVN